MRLSWILALGLSIAGVVTVVALFPALSGYLQKHRPEGKTSQMVSLGLEQLDPIFNQNRVHLTRQREHEAVMPARREDGGPPRTKIDLDGGQAVVHLPAKDTETPTT